MADPRHKRKYPDGPRQQMTEDWKVRVKSRLAENKATNAFPVDQSELATAIGVHKTAITKMFQAQSSALVEDVCRVLSIDPPLVAAAPDEPVIALVRGLSDEQKVDVLDFIRRHILRSDR